MKVLANDGISPTGKEALLASGHQLLEVTVAQDQLANYINNNGVDVLLVRSATKVRKDLIDACPGLKIIGRGGVGMDNIDVDYARSFGRTVINTPAASSQSVAELVMAHLYGGVRFLYDANRQMPLDGDTKFKDLKKAYEAGTELQGKTLGIIGFGRIGQAVAKLALGVGMKVVQHDTFPTPTEVALSFFDGQTLKMEVPKLSLEELLKTSDFVSLHVPGGDIIGAKEMAMMKDGAGIVNAARGGVVNEVALVEALNSGKLKFAALDVFVNEPTPAVQVLMNAHVSLSPHIGAATLEAQDRIGTELAELIDQHA
jgi:D-3-phosphoglycerate dehydrogenase